VTLSSLNWRKAAVVVTGALLIGATASASARGSAKSFVCLHPDKPGGWGALDLGCDADQFGDISRIESIYPAFVYNRRVPDADYQAHITKYITNMNSIIREVAKDYYLQRVPDAKPATLRAWMRAAVAVGAHESMLSHYRIAGDGRYKLMTGDHLVSHGVMQVNQEYHANKELDSSFDLVGNIVGGLDTYFVEWNRAINSSCFNTANGKNPSLETIFENRARSAYSAYNGGPGRLCRYTDRGNKWKGNDEKFFDSYHNRPYMKYVSDENQAPPVNVKCLMNGDDLCAMAKPARDKYVKSRPLVFPDGKTCLTADGTNYECATDMRVFSCLAKIDPDVLDNDPLKMDKPPTFAKIHTISDREPLCKKAVQGLIDVGSMIVLRKEILLRESVGGSPIGNTKIGRIYQVQDYDLRLGGKTERYYKIKTSGGTEGWIYGGDDQDRDEWLQVASASEIDGAQKIADQAKADREAKRVAAAQAAAAARAAQEKAEAEARAEAEHNKAKESEIVVTAPRPSQLSTNAATPSPTPAPTAKPTPAPSESAIAAAQAKAAAEKAAAEAKAADDDDSDTQAVLPVQGSVIEIVKDGGIVLRATAGESEDAPYLDQLYKGARLTVEEVATKGTENKIYLKVSSGGKSGWIYAGRTYPDVTVTKWIKIWK
jgi:hypothetical protein